jgi:redox-sensitive bicupin YhaK (pirin superfamily)
MSAGTGIQHSEFNPNADLQTKLFQIWLFPKYRNVEPRYQQITLDQSLQKNNFAQILSPNEEDEGVWIYQDAWFHLADFDKDISKTYEIKKEGNGMYVFVISGILSVNGQELETRDGFGIWNFKNLEFVATTDAKFLLMEIPMEQ